jgi:hypothetical protein
MASIKLRSASIKCFHYNDAISFARNRAFVERRNITLLQMGYRVFPRYAIGTDACFVVSVFACLESAIIISHNSGEKV